MDVSIINKYVFASFGELTLDKIYDEEYNLLKENGGYPAFNVLYNLALLGEKTYAVGTVGNDENGVKAIASLQSVSVNVDNVEIQNHKTKLNHIIIPRNNIEDNSVKMTRTSPINGEITEDNSETLPKTLPENLQNQNIIIVISNFAPQTFEFIKDAKSKCKNCKVALDIGRNKFSEFSKEYLINFLSYINLIQMNQNCMIDLYKKLEVSSNEKFFKITNLDLLTITMGHKGANYIYKDENQILEKYKKPVIVSSMLDPTGAGDAFFAMTLKAYSRNLKNEKKIDDQFIDNSFMIANCLSRQVVSRIGARGDLKMIEKVMSETNNLNGINEKDFDEKY